jgi:hypothetical protein
VLLNEKEKSVISNFLNNLNQYAKQAMTLKWDNCSQITAAIDLYFEDENDYDENDLRYEEYISFVFKVIKMYGDPPVKVNDDGLFLINYHNFPYEITVNGKKIN